MLGYISVPSPHKSPLMQTRWTGSFENASRTLPGFLSVLGSMRSRGWNSTRALTDDVYRVREYARTDENVSWETAKVSEGKVGQTGMHAPRSCDPVDRHLRASRRRVVVLFLQQQYRSVYGVGHLCCWTDLRQSVPVRLHDARAGRTTEDPTGCPLRQPQVHRQRRRIQLVLPLLGARGTAKVSGWQLMFVDAEFKMEAATTKTPPRATEGWWTSWGGTKPIQTLNWTTLNWVDVEGT